MKTAEDPNSAPTPGPTRIRDLLRDRLAREISAVLVVKILLLALMFFAFFYHPKAPSVNSHAVSAVIVGKPAPPSASSAPAGEHSTP